MSRSAFAITEQGLAVARASLELPVESAGTAAATQGGSTLLCGPVTLIDEGSYVHREAAQLVLRSDAWVPTLVPAARGGATPVFVHTHPRGRAEFSKQDDVVDLTLSAELKRLTGSDGYASLILAGDPAAPQLIARRVVDGSFVPFEVARVVGHSLALHPVGDDLLDEQVFDRQILALGQAGRRILAALTVGVVGAGGTGSSVCEQLLRLGVGHLVVIDDDVVTQTTPTRGYGSSAQDVDKTKVHVISALSDHIGLGTSVTAIAAEIQSSEALGELGRCDIIFGCTDGHASRLVLNRFAYWHHVPLVDMGVVVSTATDGSFAGIDGRVTWVAPGTTCLLCRRRVDPAIAAAERLDPAERRARAGEGYIPNLDDPSPAVVAYTTNVASTAVIEMLHRLFRMSDPTPTELLLRPDVRKVRANVVAPRPGCFCADSARWGAGYDTPHLGLIT